MITEVAIIVLVNNLKICQNISFNILLNDLKNFFEILVTWATPMTDPCWSLIGEHIIVLVLYPVIQSMSELNLKNGTLW